MSRVSRGALVLLTVCWGCASDGAGAGRGATADARGAAGHAGSAAAGPPGAGGQGAATVGGTGGMGGASASTNAGHGSAAVLPEPNVEGILHASCATATVESALLPTYLLFVIDRSGSMICNPPPVTASDACESNPTRADATMPSKWEIVQSALLATLHTLPADVSVGISYFSNDDACGVHPTPSVAVRPLDDAQLSAAQASLEGITPGGGTPIVGATVLAYQHLHDRALAGELVGNKFVVLLTDGEQSEQCVDQARCDSAAACTELLVSQEAPKARKPGVDIRTFVIGAPGSEPARTMLSELAVAGGTAPEGCDPAAGECHFDMTKKSDFAAALADALAAITGSAATCELPVPMGDEAPDLTRLNVVYSPGDGSDPLLLRQDTSHGCADGADGWQYGSDDTTIKLCGPICDTVRSDRGSRVDVVLGCPVQGPD